jgi:ABC-2 type transport system ATP-binding protein
MPETAIQTQKLSRNFGNLTAVDSIDLHVASGQFFGFLGPNGAGKSTTIKMLTGLLVPSSGSMQLLGLDFASNPVEVKRRIGVVPEGMGLFERLTGSEYLHFVGRMYGLDRATTQRRSEELLDFMQLADRPKTMIADYSHGMQKKLALAAAVIHGPRILFLDEPFEGAEGAAGAHDGTRHDNIPDFPCSGNCRTPLQPRGHHSQRPAHRPGFTRRVARGNFG